MAKMTTFGTEADSAHLRKVAEDVEAAAASVRTLHPKLLSPEGGGTVSERILYLDKLAGRLRVIAGYVERHAAPAGEGSGDG